MTNTNTSQKLAYKLSATGLFAIFAMMVIPGSVFGGAAAADSTETGQISVYGMMDLVQKDASGNTLLTQTVHNQLTTEGEGYLLNQVFDTSGTAVTDNARIGAICITGVVLADTDVAREAANAATMSASTLGLDANCLVDADVTTTNTAAASTAVIGPLEFIGGTQLTAGGTINSIAICNANAGTDYALCNAPTNGVAFAVVDTNEVTLPDGDTVEITYTFDVTSDSS